MEDYKRYLSIIKAELKNGNETNSVQLLRLCKRLHLPITGIYASDEKHKNFSNGSCFIINTDIKGNTGIHWVAGVNYYGTTYLYDSFGRNNLNFPSLRNRKIIHTQPDKEQLETQTDCGQRCISALLVFYHHGLPEYLSL